MGKTAILQVADTGPLESLLAMLRYAGYYCMLPSADLKGTLRRIGCGMILDVADLVRSGSYDSPGELPEANVGDMDQHDTIYIDVKAHQNKDKVWDKWPSLRGRTIWYRINGGHAEIVEGKGDEVNLGNLPIITPVQWYQDDPSNTKYAAYWDETKQPRGPNWGGMAYSMWPKFVKIDDYAFPREGRFTAPICLVHNAKGWGYGPMFEKIRGMGVKIHGHGSPDGQLDHNKVAVALTNAMCMVHLKSSDAPGYALYEALAAGCPVICSRRLIWRNKMQELLIPGETCLAFDRETHDGLSSEDVVNCCNEIDGHFQRLGDYGYNRMIGEAGRKKLREIMWNEQRDGRSFERFMNRHFGAWPTKKG